MPDTPRPEAETVPLPDCGCIIHYIVCRWLQEQGASCVR
jgi:hypothetical protein